MYQTTLQLYSVFQNARQTNDEILTLINVKLANHLAKVAKILQLDNNVNHAYLN